MKNALFTLSLVLVPTNLALASVSPRQDSLAYRCFAQDNDQNAFDFTLVASPDRKTITFESVNGAFDAFERVKSFENTRIFANETEQLVIHVRPQFMRSLEFTYQGHNFVCSLPIRGGVSSNGGV